MKRAPTRGKRWDKMIDSIKADAASGRVVTDAPKAEPTR